MTYSKLGTDTKTGNDVLLYKTSRFQGLYVIGATGTGKSGLFDNLIYEDGKQGIGFCVIDPHGQLIERVIARLPANREQDVILLDIRDYQYPFGLNLFTCSNLTDPLAVQEVVDRVMHVFDKLLAVTPDTPLIRQYLRNCTYTLVSNPGYTMADILLLLTDKNCRQKLVANITNPNVLLFWKQFEALKPDVQEERSSSLQRRVEEFLQPVSLPIVGQSTTTINLQKIMDEGKILLIKLDVLRFENVSNLIGSLLIALFLKTVSGPTKRKDLFNIYVDEFQRFSTKDFATLFAEARKFGIGLTVAHQFRDQLDQDNKGATLTAANMIVFRVSTTDADELAGQFNITPQVAWEEEIEKEWVEEIEKEWHERVEEVLIDGVEETKTPASNPFDWLLSHTHNNPVVNRFVDNHLRKIHLALSSDFAKEHEKAIRADFNSFLYRAMTSSNALSLLSEQSSLRNLLRLNDWYAFGAYYFGQTVPSLPDVKITSHIVSNAYRSPGSALAFGANFMSEHIYMPELWVGRDGDDTVDERIATALIAMIQTLEENQYKQASANFARLAEEKLRKRKTAYLVAY